ncbi:unnamed protein product [Penicillium pancosmium]
MRHEGDGVAKAMAAPFHSVSDKARSSVAYSKSALHINGQYVELDDFNAPADSIPPQGRSAASKSSRSKFYFPNTLWSRLFAIIGLLETFFTVGIESWIFISVSRRFNEYDNNDGTIRLRSFLGLYIFALVYELALSYDALKRKNTFQLVGLCLCNFGLFVYGVVQMKEIRETISGLSISEASGNLLWKHYQIELILIPVFIGVCTIAMIFVTWRLRAENSWNIYQSMSADLQMNRRYFTYQVYIALLKFDFFFMFGTQLQVLLAMNDFKDHDFILQSAMIPVSIVILILGARFCRLEKTKSLSVIMIFMLVIAGTFVLVILQTYTSSKSNNLAHFKVSLTLFSGLAILLLGITLVNMVICMVNFGKGLKDYINHSDKKQQTPDPEYQGNAAGKQRFVLT